MKQLYVLCLVVLVTGCAFLGGLDLYLRTHQASPHIFELVHVSPPLTGSGHRPKVITPPSITARCFIYYAPDDICFNRDGSSEKNWSAKHPSKNQGQRYFGFYIDRCVPFPETETCPDAVLIDPPGPASFRILQLSRICLR